MGIANSNPQYMASAPKEQYLSPECEVYEVKPEGVLAMSGGDLGGDTY